MACLIPLGLVTQGPSWVEVEAPILQDAAANTKVVGGLASSFNQFFHTYSPGLPHALGQALSSGVFRTEAVLELLETVE